MLFRKLSHYCGIKKVSDINVILKLTMKGTTKNKNVFNHS